MKRVYWTGKKETYLACQSHTNLEVGRCYEVIREDVGKWQTNYLLKGVKNEGDYGDPGYNSVWFKEVPVYQAISRAIPVTGRSMRNFERLNGRRREEILETSKVLEVHHLGGNVYEVYTENSTYIVSVI